MRVQSNERGERPEPMTSSVPGGLSLSSMRARSCFLPPLSLALLLLGGLWLGGCLHFQHKPSTFRPESGSAFLTLPGPRGRSWRIHYREKGKPGQPAVVMIHGYGSSSVVWVPLMDALARRGYHTVALDLPGFGLSDKYPGDYRTATIADRVAAFLTRKKIRRADVLAHSWGSAVALSLALRHRARVRRLVLHSGWVYTAQIVPVLRWAKIPGIGEMIYGMFYKERPGDKFAQSVYDDKRLVTQPLVEKIKKALHRPGAVAAALAIARGMDFRAMETKYSSLTQPTLLVWGKQDHVALPFYGRRLLSQLPRARLVLLDRCGHIPMLEQPYLVQRHVTAFLGPARARSTAFLGPAHKRSTAHSPHPVRPRSQTLSHATRGAR